MKIPEVHLERKHGIKLISISAFCIGCILLLLSLFYGGRNNVFVLITFAFFCVAINGRVRIGNLGIVLVLLVTSILHMIIWQLLQGDASLIFNVVIIYIPFILFIMGDCIEDGISGMKLVVYFFNVFIDCIFLLQVIRGGYSRECVGILKASVNLLAALNILFMCYHLSYLNSYSSKKEKTISLLLFFISVLSVLLTLSRSLIATACFILLCSLIRVLVLSCKGRKILSLIPKVLLVVFCVAFVGKKIYNYMLINSKEFRTSMESFTYYFEIMDTVGIGKARTVLWENAVNTFKDNWLLGTGSSKTVSRMGESLEAHNFFLEILLLVGTLGLIVYILAVGYMYVMCIKKCERNRRFFLILTIITYYASNYFQPFISSSFGYNMLFGWIIITMTIDRSSLCNGNQKTICLLHTISGV